jgi:hypothetical protein
MRQHNRIGGLRWGLLLAGLAVVAAGCSKHGEAARMVYDVDEALTAKAPPSASPANRHPNAGCREWRRFMSRKDTRERYWKFGCVNAASLVVSVSNKRDLEGGRPLRPSEGWEAVKTMKDDREGKLEPGQVDTSKSATTSNSK